MMGLLSFSFVGQGKANGAELKKGDPAPLFSLKTHEAKDFSLQDRKARGWTVLYFYPKADTPGCTKQACAFRDAIEVIRKEGAEVYGISADTIAHQAAFHAKYKLTFPLLADPDASVIEQYGVKMPLVKMSKRWTFIVDPELKIRWIESDVDPALDAQRVSEQLKKLKRQ